MTQIEKNEDTTNDRELVAKEDQEDEKILHRGRLSFQLIGIAALMAVGAYSWKFAPLGLSPEQEKWGQFGDFLGGFLNPAIGLVTVYLVLINVRMQRKELKNSLNELRNSNKALKEQMEAAARQDFQHTFFTWLNSYQAIVNSASYSDKHNLRTSGRDGLLTAYKIFLSDEALAKEFGKNDDFVGDPYIALMTTGKTSPIFERFVASTIMEAWSEVYRTTAHHTGSMFRTLYRLLLWVDQADPLVIEDIKKRQFITIARAQISDIELKYLFFNGFTKDGESFAYLINKHALFDNLDKDEIYLTKFLSSVENCPYEPTAYDSKLARAKWTKKIESETDKREE